MAHIDDRVMELARNALSFVYGEEHFYRQASAMTRNTGGKTMLLRLAEEGAVHRTNIHRVFGAIIGQEAWGKLVAEAAANAHPSQIVAEMEEAVAHRGHVAVADDTQALRMAMELERRVIHLLKDAADHTRDPEVIELLGKMILEECGQYDSLQAQLDSIQNVGLWLDTPEFRMDGKY